VDGLVFSEEGLVVRRPWSLEDRRLEALVGYFEHHPYFLALTVFVLPKVPLTYREIPVLKNLICASAEHVEMVVAVLSLGTDAQEKDAVGEGQVAVIRMQLYIEIMFVLYQS
jgi:hypothetical protein